MGIDTRFFGPSGWQLIHYIAFNSSHPQEFLLGIKDILPCKFCRESTAQFINELPMMKNTGRWSYELHNKVNNKLRTQCKNNPTVIDPGDNPTFEDIKHKYETMQLSEILGRDFLFSIAANYPNDPEDKHKNTQQIFLKQLSKVYPNNFEKYLEQNPVKLENRKSYMKWMYALLKHLGLAFSKVELPSFKGYSQRLAYYTSGCDKKSYKGITCRRIKGGGRTKVRDNRKTYRISHMSLL